MHRHADFFSNSCLGAPCKIASHRSNGGSQSICSGTDTQISFSISLVGSHCESKKGTAQRTSFSHAAFFISSAITCCRSGSSRPSASIFRNSFRAIRWHFCVQNIAGRSLSRDRMTRKTALQTAHRR